ncbi:MAG TPA: hypothetical protein EYP81_02915 [Thermodesulfobacteriaceae bacterium]|nr:hypothetical protein [Thermodesulfobacteriaceae bacterium]
MALLPDGEVHACRKFRFLGDLSLGEVREIPPGPEACYDCRLYAICRGCLAVIATSGLDPF